MWPSLNRTRLNPGKRRFNLATAPDSGADRHDGDRPGWGMAYAYRQAFCLRVWMAVMSDCPRNRNDLLASRMKASNIFGEIAEHYHGIWVFQIPQSKDTWKKISIIPTRRNRFKASWNFKSFWRKRDGYLMSTLHWDASRKSSRRICGQPSGSFRTLSTLVVEWFGRCGERLRLQINGDKIATTSLTQY